MEITSFEDTAKRLLTSVVPENRPPNRNRGFFLKTKPKPTDLGQCKTVTTLITRQKLTGMRKEFYQLNQMVRLTIGTYEYNVFKLCPINSTLVHPVQVNTKLSL